MTGIRNYSTNADLNTSVGGISVAEGMARPSVNNAMRAQMADVANLLLDQGGEVTTTGSGNSFLLSLPSAPSVYSDNMFFVCKLHHAITGAATLNIDGIGVKDWKKLDEGVPVPLEEGDGPTGTRAICTYSSDANAVLMIGGSGGGSSGSFIHEGDDAVRRRTQDRLRDTVHLFDFIPVAEHAQITAGTGISTPGGTFNSYDALPAIHAALRQFRHTGVDANSGPADGVGPTLVLPRGKLYISGPIEIRGMCEIVGSGGAYDGDQAFGTKIEVAANQHGIIIHAYDTYAQHKAAPLWGDRSIWLPSTTTDFDNPSYAYADWSTCRNHGISYRCTTSGAKQLRVLSWVASTDYIVGDIRENGPAGASWVYICTTAGTSAASGGPTGTDMGQADGTCVWDFQEIYGPNGTGTYTDNGAGLSGPGDGGAGPAAVWTYMGPAIATETNVPYVVGQVMVNYPSGVFPGIYECMVAGAGNSTIRPDHMSGTVAYGDDYSWKFLEEGRGGTGSLLHEFALQSLGGTKGHGIWMRSRGEIRNVYIRGFPFNGYNVVGTTNGPFERCGNTNNWRISGGRVTGCGQLGTSFDYGTGPITPGSGLFVDGSDANAGLALGVDCSNCGQWGFADESLLGNTFISCHTNTNGRRSRRWYSDTALGITPASGGVGFICVNQELGLTVPPAMDRPDVWHVVGNYPAPAPPHTTVPATGVPGPEWFAGDTYLREGSAYHNGTVLFSYAESGEIGRQDKSGNLAFYAGFSPNETVRGGSGQHIWVGGNYLKTRRLQFEQRDTHDILYTLGMFGTGDSGSDQISAFVHPTFSSSPLTETLNQEDGAIVRSHTGGGVHYTTLAGTYQNFGRTAPVPHAFYVNQLFLGSPVLNPTARDAWLPLTDYEVDALVLNDGGKTYICRTAGTSAASGGPTGTATSGIVDGTAIWAQVGASAARQLNFGSAAPTSVAEEHAAGDIVFNAAPLLGEPIGWRCILAGAPGTWQPLRDQGSQQTLTDGGVFTLTPGTSPRYTLHSGTMTANRNATLSETSALNGLSYRITRTGGNTGGPWSLNVTSTSTGVLKALAQNEWCEVCYDGTNYYLAAFGTL